MNEAEVHFPNGKALTVAGPTSLVPTQVPIEDRVLERLLNDPNADPDRIREALAIRKDIYDQRRQERLDDARETFFMKLTEAQSEMRRVVTDRENSQTHSRYATYAALDRAVRPIYTRHGFSVTFNTKPCNIENHVVTTAKVTLGLHTEEYETPPMLADGKGAQGKAVMTEIHAVGSAKSYGRRYLLIDIFNISVSNDRDDDDGNAAGGNPGETGFITEEQAKVIYKLIEDAGADLAKFLKFGKVDSVEEIPTKQYESAKKLLEERKRIKQESETDSAKGQTEGEQLVDKAKEIKAAKRGGGK